MVEEDIRFCCASELMAVAMARPFYQRGTDAAQAGRYAGGDDRSYGNNGYFIHDVFVV